MTGMKVENVPAEKYKAITNLDECPTCPSCKQPTAMDLDRGVVVCPTCAKAVNLEALKS
jgi:hypothetical protein